MASEITFDYAHSGSSLDLYTWNNGGQVWSSSVFESAASAHWTTYAASLTEQSITGVYLGTFPSVASGNYFIKIRRRVSTSPAVTDPLVGDGEMYWDGAAEITPIKIGNPVSLTASAIAASNIGGSALDATVFKTGAIYTGVVGASAFGASNIGGSAFDSTLFKSNAFGVGVFAASALGASNLSGSIITQEILSATAASQIWRSAVRDLTDKASFQIAQNGIAVGSIAASAIGASNIAGSAITQEQFSITAASQIWRAAVRDLTAMGFTVTLAQNGVPVGAFAASAISASVFAGSAIDNRVFADNAGSTVWNAAVRGITSNADKTGYTVSTVQDKTGYGLTASAIGACQFAASGIDGVALGLSGASQVWNAAVRSLTDKTGFTAAVSDKTGFSLAQNGVPVGALAASAIGASNISGSALNAPVFAGSVIDNKVFADNAGSAVWNSAVRSLTDKTGFALAASSIDANTFANGAITVGVFTTGAIAVGVIGASAIGASNLAGSTITQEQFSATAASQVWRSVVRDLTDKSDFQIAQNGLALGSIAASAIAASNIGGSALDSTLFKSNALAVGVLASSAIGASNLAGSLIDNKTFAATAGSVVWNTAVRSLTDEIGFTLAASSIDSNTFANDAITAGVFADGAIAVSKLGASAISASNIAGSAFDSTVFKLSAFNVGIIKNVALSNFEFFITDSADHITAKTGLTLTSQRSIDGGVFAATVNNATEVGSGIYKINLAATDLNGDIITLKFSSIGADTRLITLRTQS